MDELVERLSQGRHPVELSLRPDKSMAVLAACLDRGYVHVRFLDTQGGTELGVRLDKAASEWPEANLTHQEGTIRLVGQLSLNFVPVQCVAEVDLRTLTGEGFLQPL